MPHPARPSLAAYTAAITPLPLHHPALRRVRLSGRQVATLAGTPIPLAIDGNSTATPCAQAELAIQAATRATLGGRETLAVLYRWSNGGELWVMCSRSFVKVGRIELTPAEVAA